MHSKKKVALRTGRLPAPLVKKLKDLLKLLYNVDPDDYVKGVTRYTCFNPELCVIYSGEHPFSGAFTLYGGLWIALFVKRTLVPSINIASRIYKEHNVRAAIVVADKGIKAFLYGNDILPQSVLKVIPPNHGIYAVLDPVDNEVVGFVRWNTKKHIYENLYDAGIFLRVLG